MRFYLRVWRQTKSSLCIVFGNVLIWIVLYSLLGMRVPYLENGQTVDLYSAVNKNLKGLTEEDQIKHLPAITSVKGFNTTKLVEEIQQLAIQIHKAKIHVRGTKTSDYLTKATENIESVLRMFQVNSSDIYKRPVRKPKSVCPEMFMGSKYGLPFFEKGFVTIKCDNAEPLWKLVTILVIFEENNNFEYSFKKYISSVFRTYEKLNIVVSSTVPIPAEVRSQYPTLTFIKRGGESDGEMYNTMLTEVKTPYVLMSRDIEYITNDSRLERLVREIESLDVVAVAGAIRDSKGHWQKGCYQTAYRNFTLKYVEGYDESLHECLFCDYIEGPFVASTQYLITHNFKHLNIREGLFEGWFLQIFERKEEMLVCPDALFHILNRSSIQIEWRKFMVEWNLFKVITLNGQSVQRNCDDQSYSTKHFDALSHCNLHFNAKLVQTVMGACENNSIICELQEGTALGAVKLGKVLPWERDADITFLTANYSVFQNLKKEFLNQGMGFSDLDGVWCCVDNRTAGGKLLVQYRGWYAELYGQHIMDSERLMKNGIKPTQILLDGKWLNVPRNPGLFVRNRYGKEIYQHAQHWMTLKEKHGWIDYKTNVFKPCAHPGGHDCLDRYNGDGNIQFSDILP